ncbi:MAG: hypothetical protein BGO12_19880 [Verrucomicrobia bacterium 61-8]|nr:MAG: hypothetical protein BGO12_19880 [Verrucomicrobia bacterium 61-8]
MTLTVGSLGLANNSHAAPADPVLDSYVAVADALAKDDLAAAKKAAGTLADTAKAEKQTSLADHAEMIASSDSLDAARGHFKMVSEEAVTLAQGKEGYYVMTCPMAKADWVQKTTKVSNPYMGQEMPGCGSIKGGASMGTMKMGGCCG